MNCPKLISSRVCIWLGLSMSGKSCRLMCLGPGRGRPERAVLASSIPRYEKQVTKIGSIYNYCILGLRIRRCDGNFAACKAPIGLRSV